MVSWVVPGLLRLPTWWVCAGSPEFVHWGSWFCDCCCGSPGLNVPPFCLSHWDFFKKIVITSVSFDLSVPVTSRAFLLVNQNCVVRLTIDLVNQKVFDFFG